MSQAYLGIDVSKKTLDVALSQETRLKERSFANEATGWKKLQQWLKKRKVSQLHVCLEATGRYGDGVAKYLHQQDYQVSVVNPKRTKAYGEV